MDREPSAPLKAFQIQPTRSLVTYGHGLYTHGLELTGESEKAPVSSAVMVIVEGSRICAMFTLLQGWAMEGPWDSPLMGTSLRSRVGGFGGAMAA